MPWSVADVRYYYLSLPGVDEQDAVLTSFTGREAVSELYEFQIDVLADPAKALDFSSILGKPVAWGTQTGDWDRDFAGLAIEMSQMARGSDFQRYRFTIVPRIWVLTQISQSRIFQQKSIPDILKAVLEGFDVDYLIQGTFDPREYCVQYQETDFNFISRLMEEEGIYYFFKFSEGKETMVVTNSPPGQLDDVDDPSSVHFDIAQGGLRDELRVSTFTRTQFVRSGKVTLWDHHFQLPHKHLEAEKPVLPSPIPFGTVSHKLGVDPVPKLEIFESPGRYAQRFDGIATSGGEQASQLQKIYTDNSRTVGIRMKQEEAAMLRGEGTSNCRNFVAGHKFTLQDHPNADGAYAILSVQHDGYEGDQRAEHTSTSAEGLSHYQNVFTCIPTALAYSPPRVTPRPRILGPQTAVVTGPQGEEIFTDKYGRVKVQFHWDREGKYDASSSCWVRVATTWGGLSWGMVQIPRIGQEVVVAFIDGDTDRPIIVGSVFNAQTMPPYKLPDLKHVNSLQSRSTPKGTADNRNEIRMSDKKGAEQLFIHAEYDRDDRTKHDAREFTGNDKHMITTNNDWESVGADKGKIVGGNELITIGGSKFEKVGGARLESVGGAEQIKIGGARKLIVGGAQDVKIGGAEAIKVGGDLSLNVGGSQNVKTSQTWASEAGQTIHLKGGMTVIIEAGMQLSLKGPGGFVDIGPAGVSIQGTMVLINSGGAAGSGPGSNPTAPDESLDEVKKPTAPDKADDGSKFTKL